jgi:hypothetical protein
MKKIQAIILALAAVTAFGAVLVSSASAETTLLASWLVGGAEVASALNTETSGSLLLEDTATPAGAAAVLCSAILDGTVNSNGKGTIKEVLNLAKELIGELKTGLALVSPTDCSSEKICSNTGIELRPVGLPWTTNLYLMENGEILIEVQKAGYDLSCTVIIKVEDTCTGTAAVPVINDSVTGDAETMGEVTATPNASCTLSNNKLTGVNETDELAFITLVGSSELLTVSSE